MTSVIETRALTKTYGTVRALDGLSLEIPKGGSTAFWARTAPASRPCSASFWG
jgi:ABC-type multidrug transport system ATPase subunit